MKKYGRLDAPEQPRQLDLTAGRCQQVVAADDERHLLDVVVHGRSKLVGPVSFTIFDQEIAALRRWPLLLRAVTKIDEPFDGRLEPDAQSRAGLFGQPALAARTRIAELGGGIQMWGRPFRPPAGILKGCLYTSHGLCGGDLRARAVACVHKSAAPKPVEGLLVDIAALALADQRSIGLEPEPREVV